jgi:hypothetical protein
MNNSNSTRNPPGLENGLTHPQRDVSIHIDRLAIEGLPITSAQGVQLQQALQTELTRLIQGEGGSLAVQSAHLPTLAIPAITVASPFSPADLGRQVARSLYTNLALPR